MSVMYHYNAAAAEASPPPPSLASWKYVVYLWHKAPVFRKDPLAKEFFAAQVQPIHAIFKLLRTSSPTITLYEGTIPPSTPELWLTFEQCDIIKAKLGELMGPTRVAQSWRFVPVESARIQGLRSLSFPDHHALGAHLSTLRALQDGEIVKDLRRHLVCMRDVYERLLVRKAPAVFFSLDVETWERDHTCLTEFGWSWWSLTKEVGGDQHVAVLENYSRRNGKYCADAKDHYDFGLSRRIPQSALLEELLSLLDPSLRQSPIFLICHDPRTDLQSLELLGVPTQKFVHDVRNYHEGDHVVVVVDTQVLFGGLKGDKKKVGLEAVCRELGVQTKRLHNAGNDAHYTLDAFKIMMEPSLHVPSL